MEIEFNLSGLDPFVLLCDDFNDLYLYIKQRDFDQFQLQAFKVLPLGKKIRHNVHKEDKVITDIVQFLQKKIILHEHINKDNMFLSAETDLYELTRGYNEQIEKQIRDVIEEKYQEMVVGVGG